jgi:glycerol-3-phosphate responsive antiterminator
MKKQLTKSWSFSNLISLLQKHLFSYVNFIDFFNNVDKFAIEFVKNKGKPDGIQGELTF